HGRPDRARLPPDLPRDAEARLHARRRWTDPRPPPDPPGGPRLSRLPDGRADALRQPRAPHRDPLLQARALDARRRPPRTRRAAGGRRRLPRDAHPRLMAVDFGLTAEDYARHRAGFPDSLFG